jgi:hypothetical protein
MGIRTILIYRFSVIRSLELVRERVLQPVGERQSSSAADHLAQNVAVTEGREGLIISSFIGVPRLRLWIR